MTGVIIGRFMPPHSGHLYLTEFARGMVDRLYVLVCTLSHEPIPGELRYAWMQELAPHATIVHITEEIPAARRGEAGATAIWARTVQGAVPEAVTHVFASEPYGWELAAHLDARFVPVDTNRRNIPVSATAIREDPLAHWRFIPPVVRPYFVRHLAVVGAIDLARSLADELGTVVVHPYRRVWDAIRPPVAVGGPLPGTPGALQEEASTHEVVVRGARASIAALARQANRVLIHDLETVDEVAALPDVDLVVSDDPVPPLDRGRSPGARWWSPAGPDGVVPRLELRVASADTILRALNQ